MIRSFFQPQKKSFEKAARERIKDNRRNGAHERQESRDKRLANAPATLGISQRRGRGCRGTSLKQARPKAPKAPRDRPPRLIPAAAEPAIYIPLATCLRGMRYVCPRDARSPAECCYIIITCRRDARGRP